MVNQISDEEICPEEHRDEGPLCISDEEICPESIVTKDLSAFPMSIPVRNDHLSRA